MQIDRIGVHESVAGVFPAEQLHGALADAGFAVTIVLTPAEVGTVDALVTLEWEADWLDAGLRWIHSIQAGVDRFPFEALRERGIVLTSSSGVHTDTVGETVAAFMLTFARRFHRYAKNQVEHAWRTPAWDEPFQVGGRTVCIVGLGSLGRGIARRADGLDMHVIGVKRTVEDVPHVDEVFPADELDVAIADAHFVALACPLTDETRHLIDADALRRMRDDAYLINVARGAVVDESALIGAIRDGVIAGAGLDVFEEEPLPEDSPLWDLEDVLITPHKAGSWEGYYRGVAEIVLDNLGRLDAGEELRNRVV